MDEISIVPKHRKEEGHENTSLIVERDSRTQLILYL
jgi:hypothetical protein